MDTRASVAMAVYNGERYIREQIDSILKMMAENDELVISYDESSDSTWVIISEYAHKDGRVKLYKNKEKGIRSNFNNAIKHCSGRYIFLSDQDDVWLDNKIDKVVSLFVRSDVDIITHNGYFTDDKLNIRGPSIFEFSKASANPIRNYLKSTCWGCCMAFTDRIKEVVYPFPKDINHDTWISIIGPMYGEMLLLNEKLIYHRLHDSNETTGRRRLDIVLKDRCRVAKNLVLRKINLAKRRPA